MDRPAPYVSLQEFSALSGLSLSTPRRRIRDGALRAYQPGGRRTRVLLRRDALEQSPVPCRSIVVAGCPAPSSAPLKAETGPLPVSDMPGPKPRWTRTPR